MKDEIFDYAFRSTWLSIMGMYNEQSEEFGFTATFGFTLLSIGKNGTPSMALGPKMGISPTSLSRILLELEKKGTITREPNPKDGRSVLITLTPFGKELRDIAKEKVLAFNNKILESLEPGQAETFFEVVDKVKQIINQNKKS